MGKHANMYLGRDKSMTSPAERTRLAQYRDKRAASAQRKMCFPKVHGNIRYFINRLPKNTADVLSIIASVMWSHFMSGARQAGKYPLALE